MSRLAHGLAATHARLVACALAVVGVPAVTATRAVAPVLAGPPQPAALSAELTPTAQTEMLWSAPTAIGACAAQPAARVVFPSEGPSRATGAGAIVWSASSRCPGGEGTRVDAIGAGDQPAPPAVPHSAAGRALVARGALLAGGAPHGQIVIAGASPGASSSGLLIQGLAGGPFEALKPVTGTAAPIALATAYLGDMALASPSAGGDGDATASSLNIHVERFFAHDFVRNVTVPTAGPGPLQALTLAMDYRSEVLAVWAQGGAVYARVVPNRGAPRQIQRLASIGLQPQIAAVLSDDERAIVAWSERRGSETAVYVDRSAPGVRFGEPELLERFSDPDGLPSPAASPSLVRLSSEGVMLAWAGAAAGRWVVRTAPVDLNGVGAPSTIAAPATDALLADLAAGPDADALVLWTEPLPTAAGPPDMNRQALFAARGFDGYQAHAAFGEPEQIAPPGPVSDATVAFDPANDRAVAAWQGEAARIEYSIRAGAPGP